jgi:molybdopterin molybdotransferase
MLLNPDQALELVLADISPIGKEIIPVFDGLGRVVASQVCSKRDIPLQDSSAMDGYAIKHADIASVPVTLKVKGVIAAGDSRSYSINNGECYRIMTGAYVPAGADTVVEYELTDDGREQVVVNKAVKLGSNIRPKSDDIAKGALIDYVGERLSPYHISRFVSAGILYTPAYRKPRVAVISTGSEIASPCDYDDNTRMMDANAPAIIAMLQEAGADCSYMGVVPDEEAPLLDMLLTMHNFDMVVVSGGISTGDFDYMASISAKAGIEWRFHKVNQKPGKPIAFGVINFANHNKNVPIFGLPGNPVSCMFCNYFYIIPTVKKMQGETYHGHKALSAVLGEPMSKKAGRILFDRVKIEVKNGVIHAYPFKSQNSNLIDSMTQCHAFMRLGDEMNGELPIGTPVQVYIFNADRLI